ncbi:MAG: triose-phosphate isomerase [Sporomusaceae bacterium]|nr:triose-phosphate isomerase [Sporomusaceae bacterium]
MRKPIIAANWKMHKTATAAEAFARELCQRIGRQAAADVVVCPAFTALLPVGGVIKQTPMKLGAQNMHWEEQGAFTGEISPAMLRDAGCDYVIIGHSERRQYFAETDEAVNRKLQTALLHNLTPIVCVGETLAQREAGQTEAVVSSQVRLALAGLKPEAVAGIVIAYEPVWAIGTGRTASAADAQAVCLLIRTTLAELAGAEAAALVRIQYGGSVKADNIDELMAQPDIDGALVGGASLDAATFARIVHFQ